MTEEKAIQLFTAIGVPPTVDEPNNVKTPVERMTAFLQTVKGCTQEEAINAMVFQQTPGGAWTCCIVYKQVRNPPPAQQTHTCIQNTSGSEKRNSYPSIFNRTLPRNSLVKLPNPTRNWHKPRRPKR
jgi:hypothetical protein